MRELSFQGLGKLQKATILGCNGSLRVPQNDFVFGEKRGNFSVHGFVRFSVFVILISISLIRSKTAHLNFGIEVKASFQPWLGGFSCIEAAMRARFSE
jgi:hypothetical protein